jgi:flagellar biosynthetic protein FlhB
MAEGKEDRTQPATQRRLERAREEGQVPLSREVAGLAGLSAATLLLMMVGPQLGQTLVERLAGLLGETQTLEPVAALHRAAFFALMFTGPIAFAIMLTSVASTLLQTQVALRPSAPIPDFSRIDPRKGLTRLYGVGGLVEQLKALVKFVILAWAAWSVLSGALPLMDQAALWLPGQIADHLIRQIVKLMLMLLGAQAIIAAADVSWVRYRHFHGLRMTREEVKQDNKEADGNPQIKARIRMLRHARAKQRMMAAVPKATVVVTNPTHYAIALVYERGRPGAPRVVAKGVDEVAARIREVAKDNRVPLVVNPPLARALYTVDLDAEIPAEHFKAVAEIIAYVWRLRGRPR